MPNFCRSAALAVAIALPGAACADFPPRSTPQNENVVMAADTAVDSTPATPPARRTRATRSRPSGTRPATATDSSRIRDSAPPPAPAPRPSPSTGLRRDLQRLVSAQEQHIANVGRYASRMQYLALRYLPQPGDNLIIESASDSGWVGRATRDGWPGGSCVVWVGRVAARPQTERQKLQSSQSGVAVCDSL